MASKGGKESVKVDGRTIRFTHADKVLYEGSRKNNVSLRKVVIGGSKEARTVEVAKVGIVDEPPVELPDDEGARLVANGTVEPTDAPEAEADESAPVRKARAKA